MSRRITTVLNGKAHHPPKQDLLSDLIELHQAKPEFTEVYLRRMAMTNFGAGHETTTSALTAIFAMVGSHPGVQKRILEETRGHDASPGDSDTAMNLTYTNATIREAQRLYPAIGMSLPRTVPASGMHAHNHYFPPGTVVGCNPVSLHRNQDIFGEDAEEFRPERWLEADPEQRRSMERYNLTWGGGARTCPGRHLAEMILQRVAPAMVKAFEIHAVVPRDEDMPMYFMAMMTDVMARFLPRDAAASPSSS
jgi:cytochrome P450